MHVHDHPPLEELQAPARSLRSRVARHDRGGPAALRERPHPGRPPSPARPGPGRFQERPEAGPTPEAGIRTFHGHDLRPILGREFAAAPGLQAACDPPHRRGFGGPMPRPRHEGADEELREVSGGGE